MILGWDSDKLLTTRINLPVDLAAWCKHATLLEAILNIFLISPHLPRSWTRGDMHPLPSLILLPSAGALREQTERRRENETD